MSNTGNLVFVLFILMGIALFTFCLNEVLTKDYGTKNVPCYDKYGNEIKDQVCIEETSFEDDGVPVLILTFFVSIMVGFMGWIIKSTLIDFEY